MILLLLLNDETIVSIIIIDINQTDSIIDIIINQWSIINQWLNDSIIINWNIDWYW